MDYYTEAQRLVYELKPKARYPKYRLKQEAQFWNSLYNIDWRNEKRN